MARGVSLQPLFSPRSVAVVGASSNPAKAGHAMLAALVSAPVPVHAVNPRGGEILGRTAVGSLTEIPGDPVDLAVLAVPPAAVPGALRDGAQAGVRAAVVCAGGFSEAGDEQLEREVAAIARAAGIRLLGPNTSGFVAPPEGVFASFVPGVSELEPGGLAVVAQSGGINHVLAFAAQRHGGLRLAVGLGNAVDVDVPDVLEHLAEDPSTRAVALGLEGIRDGPRLRAALERLTERVPVVALKAGRADVGAFARSHTGALLDDHTLGAALLRQAGAVVVADLEELVVASAALGDQRLRPGADPGAGVVTGQAGPGLLIGDELLSRGVRVPELGTATSERLAELLPPITFQRNPVDTGRPGVTFPAVVDAVARDPEVDVVVVYALHEPGALDVDQLARTAADGAAPVVFATGGPHDQVEADVAVLRAAGISALVGPDQAARAGAALVADARAQHRRRRPRGRPYEGAPVALAAPPWDELAAKRSLAALGFRVPASRACHDRDAAYEAARALGWPVVAKLLDASVTHKTEVGAVHVGLRDLEELERALDRIDDATRRQPRYLVEQHVPAGPELIVGARRDPVHGVAVLLGLGGAAAEALGVTVVRVAPLTHADALDMLTELPGGRLLDGFRGAPIADRDELASLLQGLAWLLDSFPEVSEVECNPVVVTPAGAVVVDALLVPGGGPEAPRYLV